jgi:hypothetical protein
MKLFSNYLPYDLLLSKYFNDNKDDVNMLIGSDIQSNYVGDHVGLLNQKRIKSLAKGTNLVNDIFIH